MSLPKRPRQATKRRRVIVSPPSYDFCRTCRNRKVRCDGTRPACTNCIRGGRECVYATWRVDLPFNQGHAGLTPLAIEATPRGTSVSTSSPVDENWEESKVEVKVELDEENELMSAPERRVLHHDVSRLSTNRPGDANAQSQRITLGKSRSYLTRQASPLVSSILSRMIEDAQIFAVFAEAHTSRLGLMNSCLEMVLTDHSSSRLVQDTLKALGWALASTTERGNRTALTESRTSYGSALASVAGKLSAIQHGRGCGEKPAAILCSIEMLALHRDASSSSISQTQDEWQYHIRGAQQYAKTRGGETLLYGDAVLGMWYMGYTLNLAQRREGPLGLEQWRAASLPDTYYGVPIGDWFPAILPLPGLLQQVDEILAMDLQQVRSGYVRNLMRALDHVRADASEWSRNNIVAKLVPTVSDNLDLSIEEHQLLLNSETFEVQIGIPKDSLQYCAFDALTQIVCLLADCAHLRLYSHFTTTDSALQDLLRRDVEGDAYAMACSLCQSVYALSQADSVTFAMVLQLVVDVAAAFFGDYGAVEELEFCRACRKATAVRLSRLQDGQPRTFCRVADVAPLLAASARYK